MARATGWSSTIAGTCPAFASAVRGQGLETLTSTSPNPLSAVIVQRVVDPQRGRPTSCLVIRRRWIAGGMRDEIEVRQTSSQPAAIDLDMEIGADFAHVFDVKGGRRRAGGRIDADDEGWLVRPVDLDDEDVATRVRWTPPATVVDPGRRDAELAPRAAAGGVDDGDHQRHRRQLVWQRGHRRDV